MSDFVQVKVSVPKGLVEFLRDLSAFGGSKLTPKEWIEQEVVSAAEATIDQIEDSEYIQGAFLRKKYGLAEEKSAGP
jgi:hypothetical protein